MNKIYKKELMENLFKEDFIVNEKYTYLSQLGVITIKSLMPLKDNMGVRIDYKRFVEELKLWKKYRLGENKALLNLKENKSEVYWKEEDDSIFTRIIPIIIANENWDIIKEEVVKNIIFTTGNIKDMFEYLSIAYVIYMIIEREADLLPKLKEKIIGFAQVEFLEEYEKFYKNPIDTYPGNYKVEFEKEKIQIISLLNGVSVAKYYKLEDILKYIAGKDIKTFIGKILKGLTDEDSNQINLPGFYKNLSTYLVNLSKGKINSEQLQVKEYILPDVFSFKEGDVFYHTLLNDSKIIKKEVSNGKLTSLVQTKTGMYLFEKVDL